jgi:hypothetical protein
MARRILIAARLDDHANPERMHDVKTRALEAMLRCRIVAPASSNLVARIVSGTAGMKQIKGARQSGESQQSRSQRSERSIQRLKNRTDS